MDIPGRGWKCFTISLPGLFAAQVSVSWASWATPLEKYFRHFPPSICQSETISLNLWNHLTYTFSNLLVPPPKFETLQKNFVSNWTSRKKRGGMVNLHYLHPPHPPPPPPLPIGSMYGIFTYIWLIFMVNVGIYTIHGSYGLNDNLHLRSSPWLFAP